MKVFNLDIIPWKDTQLIYHALAYNNIESLVLHSPKDSYVSLGLHQNPLDELDIKFCNKKNIRVFRREIGGGTVLLDHNQIFYNLILHRNNPMVPYAHETFFRKFLQPIIQTYHELGIKVKYHPLCDLVVNNKKISGNGGGEIGECKVLGGSILIDFDYKIMTQIVNLIDCLKDKFLELMYNNLTTVRKELGYIPATDEIRSTIISKFEELLGPLKEEKIDKKLITKMKQLDEKYSSNEWMYQRGTKQLWREIKIREGVYLINKTFDMKKGLIKITCEINENKVSKVIFSSKFTTDCSCQQEIKDKITGMEYESDNLLNTINQIIQNCEGDIVG